MDVTREQVLTTQRDNLGRRCFDLEMELALAQERVATLEAELTKLQNPGGPAPVLDQEDAFQRYFKP